MSITVLRPGLLTSIQDLGRYGYQKYGVIVSGAMDSYALRVANLLVGNKEGEATLEMTLMGPSLLVEKDILIAITGGDLSPTINGEPVPMWRPVYVKKGTILQFGACQSGCRSYLSVAGGYEIPEVMGSKSTYLRAGIGGFQGRAMAKDDVLKLGSPQEISLRIVESLMKKLSSYSFASTAWHAENISIPHHSQPSKIRVTVGSQFEHFTSESKSQFFQCPFQVTNQSDRMGYRLTGPNLQLAKPLEMVSEAVTLGTIQVPPDGNPILLLADRQTVGGYPKFAQVITVDSSIVAQTKPGGTILFQEISLAEAEQLYIAREKEIKNLGIAIRFKMS